MSQPRILVVEDERIVARDILNRLRRVGYEQVASAGSGEEALELCRRLPFDLVLMDVDLRGGLDGIEAATRLREIRDLPVVYVSAYADAETLQRAKETQPFGFLIKPFEERELVTTVEVAMFKHEAEEALRRSEANFRALIERAPDAVGVIREKRFVYVNRAALELLGYEGAEGVVGEPVLAFVHPEDQDRVRAGDGMGGPGAAVRPLEEREAPRTEVRVLHRDGSVRIVELSAFDVVFDGTPATVAVSRDLTERKRMEVQLTLADRMASVGTLAAGVAHEVSNPLTYALHNVDWISETLPRLEAQAGALHARLSAAPEGCEDLVPLVEALGELGERAQRAADGLARVRTIIRDLKTFSRMEEESHGPVQVIQPLQAALNMAHNELKYRARVTKEIHDTPLVRANQGRLSQVFLNLLVNAAQAIPEGRVDDNEVRVRVWPEGDEVRVEVSDTGHGIPQRDLERLFDPFFTTKPPGVGSGLGLSICHNIVTAAGGRIEVDSEPGRGSRFAVILPVARDGAAEADEEGPAAPPEPETRAPRPLPPPDAAGVDDCRVLVVDDEVDIRRTLQNLLRHACRIRVAESGAHARALIEEGAAVDVILCDVMMPEVSGMEFHAWLKTERPELAERVIFMTGGAFTENARAYLEQVDNPRIEKPFRLDRLQAMIRSVSARFAPEPG